MHFIIMYQKLPFYDPPRFLDDIHMILPTFRTYDFVTDPQGIINDKILNIIHIMLDMAILIYLN